MQEMTNVLPGVEFGLLWRMTRQAAMWIVQTTLSYSKFKLLGPSPSTSRLSCFSLFDGAVLSLLQTVLVLEVKELCKTVGMCVAIYGTTTLFAFGESSSCRGWTWYSFMHEASESRKPVKQASPKCTNGSSGCLQLLLYLYITFQEPPLKDHLDQAWNTHKTLDREPPLKYLNLCYSPYCSTCLLTAVHGCMWLAVLEHCFSWNWVVLISS